jgi:hypothetical protein
MLGWLPLWDRRRTKGGYSGLMPGSGGPIKQISDPRPRRLAGAQNVQIWTASLVIGIEPMPAQAGRRGLSLASLSLTVA